MTGKRETLRPWWKMEQWQGASLRTRNFVSRKSRATDCESVVPEHQENPGHSLGDLDGAWVPVITYSTPVRTSVGRLRVALQPRHRPWLLKSPTVNMVAERTGSTQFHTKRARLWQVYSHDAQRVRRGCCQSTQRQHWEDRWTIQSCSVVSCHLLRRRQFWRPSRKSSSWRPWRRFVQITPHRTHTRALLLAAIAACNYTFGSWAWRFSGCLQKSFHHWSCLCWMFLLTTYCLTDAADWNQTKPVRDHLAIRPIRLQTQPVSQRSASMSVASTRRSTFRPETWVSWSTTRRSPIPRTLIYLNIPEHQEAGQHTAASRVPTRVLADSDCVASRLASRRLVRTWIVKQLFQVFSGLCVKGEEGSRPKRCANIKRQARSPQNLWTESWVGRLRRNIGSAKIIRSWGRRRSFEHWEKREIRILIFTRPITSSSPNDYSCNRRVNGLIRLKETKAACMENWKMRNGRIRENQAKGCQEIGEWENMLRRNWANETSKKGRTVFATTEESCDRESDDGPNSGSTENSKFLVRCERILRSWNSEHLWGDPRSQSNPLLFRVTEPCLAAILDCRMVHGILWVLHETFLNDNLLDKDEPLLSSTIQRIWHPLLKNWDLTFLEIRSNRKVKWDENGRIRRASKVKSYWWNLFSQWYDWLSRYPISELHLGKFPDSMKFRSWKVNCKTQVCSKTADPHHTMHWIKRVEIAKTIDELMTSRSVLERHHFKDCDMLDAVVASALKRLLDKHIHFLKRMSVEEQRAQKYHRFLRGRQNCLHGLRAFPCNRSSWSSTSTLRFVHNDVQDLDVRWDQALFISKRICLQMWSWKDCTSRNYRALFGFRLFWLCMTKKQFEMMGRQVIDDWRHLLNFILIRWWELETSESGAKLWEEEQSARVKKERKPAKRGKCFQWKAHGQCSQGDSFCFSHDRLVRGDLYSGLRRKGRSSSPAPNSKAKTDERWGK